MTINELIEDLKQYPKDMPVIIQGPSWMVRLKTYNGVDTLVICADEEV